MSAVTTPFTSTIEASYGFDSVAIKQKKNKVTSRLAVDCKSEIMRGVHVLVPLVASNMSTVINSAFLNKLLLNGAFGFLHRAYTDEAYVAEVKKVRGTLIPVSIGVGEDQYALAIKLIDAGANVILIDIAHGYCDPVINLGRRIKEDFPHVKVVVGNTTNPDMMREVADFADAVKIGIGQGFACETKNTAGCTEKQFSCVLKFKHLSKELGLPVISDGGTREPADFVKAIAAGANSVMAGSIFARCPESAAPLVDNNGAQKKLYAGMASRYVQDIWKGGVKEGTCTEGGVRLLDPGVNLEALLEKYTGALRSGITYAGAASLTEFQNVVEFIRLV